MADLEDAGLTDRIANLKALRDQATADADRTVATLENSGSNAVTPGMRASAARDKMRV